MMEYTQRTSEKNDYPVMVSLKTDLINRFYDDAGKAMKSVGAHFFSHNLIKNCLQEGHTTSSFHTNPDWQEKYWKDYWYCDPLWSASYPIAQINGCAVTSWKVIDPNDNCTEDRKTMCKVKDGISFYMKHDNGVVENFSFAWEKYDVNLVNRQKLAKLYNMITDFRIQHFRLNRDMFDVYPAVDFH